MGMQNNFRLSKTKNNILYALSGVTLTLFAGLILFPAISDSTHAEGDAPDDGITITVDNEVTANLVLFDEGDYKIAKDTVSVSSSAAYGYELFLTTDSETHQSIYLNDDPTSESRIAPVSGTIAEPATLTNNTWGFAIAGQGNFDNEYDPANPDPASRFAIIPTADDQQAVFENNAATAEDNIDFYYGIKVEPTLEVGEYTTSAEYTATAKLPPLTAKAVLGDNGNLNFIYDHNNYVAEDAYTDNIGETTITNVYEVPMNSVGCIHTTQMPWYDQRTSITAVNFDTSFANANPTGTCGWFRDLQYMTGITNQQNLSTGNVTDMSLMFSKAGYNAATFSLDLSGWDVSNVTNMRSMFFSAGNYATTWSIGDLSGWNTGSVTTMESMFYSAGFRVNTWSIGDISSWDVSNVTSMSSMFSNAGSYATTFSLDLSGWNTGSVISMSHMFNKAGFNAATFKLDLSGWDTGSVTNMSYMFDNAGRHATTWKLDLSGWSTTSSVTNMRNMFNEAGYRAATFKLDLSGWDTSSVTNMTYMFWAAGREATTWSIGDISGWKTGNVTDMSYMFSGAGRNSTTWNIGDLSGWNTGNVTDMAYMFSNAGYSATTWNIGSLSGWNTNNVTNMNGMFKGAGYSAATFNLNISGWGTGNVINMSYMFDQAGYSATTWNIGDVSGWNVAGVKTYLGFIHLNSNGSNASVVNNQPNWNN